MPGQEPSWGVDEGVQRAAASQDRLPSPLLVVGVGVVDPRRRHVVELLARAGRGLGDVDDLQDLGTAEAGDLHGSPAVRLGQGPVQFPVLGWSPSPRPGTPEKHRQGG